VRRLVGHALQQLRAPQARRTQSPPQARLQALPRQEASGAAGAGDCGHPLHVALRQGGAPVRLVAVQLLRRQQLQDFPAVRKRRSLRWPAS